MLKDQLWILRRPCRECDRKGYCHASEWRLESGPFGEMGGAAKWLRSQSDGRKCECDWAVVQVDDKDNWALRAFAGTEHIPHTGQYILTGIANSNLTDEIRTAWYGPQGEPADPSGPVCGDS